MDSKEFAKILVEEVVDSNPPNSVLFLEENETSNENIDNKLLELYPEESRKLDHALYRLGAELEENICGKTPDCEKCKQKFPKLNKNCPYLNE